MQMKIFKEEWNLNWFNLKKQRIAWQWENNGGIKGDGEYEGEVK